jgi:eukaryotic-like serine/threonine-protein kinase
MDTLQTLGKYQIRGILGRGAMGTVYDGWDPLIARRVAIKTVPLPADPDDETQEEIARFRREAQAAGRLSHPTIVAVYDYGETPAIAYIVMEFVDGPSLKDLLDKREKFALADIKRVMGDLLAGLQFSHERGVVHRDIKPANIMLTSDRRAKIADFGIARLEMSSMTQAGAMLGTPAYMSPEQFLGQVVDPRSDVYSAAVVLYQLLTGERPFDGNITAIMQKALHAEIPTPSVVAGSVPKAFDAVISRAMAKKPADRYEGAAAFATAINAAIDTATSAPGTAPPKPPVAVPVAKPPGSKLPLMLGGGAVLVLALAGGAYVALRPAPSKPPQQQQASAVIATPPRQPAVTPPPATQTQTPPPAPTAQPATPVPSPPKTQAPTQTAVATPPAAATSIAAIRPLVASTSCALIEASASEGGAVSIFGLAGRPDAEALRRQVPDTDWRVTELDPVFCPALDALRPVAPLAGAPDRGLSLSMFGGRTTLHDGDLIQPRIAMPDFAGELRVDYVGHDGSVVHLFPTLADPSQHAAAQPQRRFTPGEHLSLGDPLPNHAAWEVGPPYGTDMVIAVASAIPLHVAASDNTEDNASTYLHNLAAAISEARQQGTSITATALTVNTVPK